MTKRMLTFLGLALILAGCLALAYQEIRDSRRARVLDVGALEASTQMRNSLDIPPVVGGLIVAGGVVLLVLGVRKSRDEVQES